MHYRSPAVSCTQCVIMLALQLFKATQHACSKLRASHSRKRGYWYSRAREGTAEKEYCHVSAQLFSSPPTVPCGHLGVAARLPASQSNPLGCLQFNICALEAVARCQGPGRGYCTRYAVMLAITQGQRSFNILAKPHPRIRTSLAG